MAAKPYLLVSDLHFHKWSTFATVTKDGLNSRLQIMLEELLRAVDELRERGGDTMYVAGDMFHERGKIDPEVFNPVHATFEAIAGSGVGIHAIPGNHDLASRDTTELGNAIQSFRAIKKMEVVTQPTVINKGTHRVFMLPWQRDLKALRDAIAKNASCYATGELMQKDRSQTDLIIHAGIDGVLSGVPAHGLTPEEVASWGFKRVFAGDYHHHVEMEGGKVVSIGPLTHQTWGDIGIKAGFLFVYPDKIEYRASRAPAFVELSEEDDPEEYPIIADGNYVRVRGLTLTDKEELELRDALIEMGAKGVQFHTVRSTVSARDPLIPSAKTATLDESVDKFVDTMKIEDEELAKLVKTAAAGVLAQVRSVAA